MVFAMVYFFAFAYVYSLCIKPAFYANMCSAHLFGFIRIKHMLP